MTTVKKSLSILFLLLRSGLCFAQQTTPQEDVPRAVISEVQKIPDGGFLFAVRIYASKKETLFLTGPKVIPKPDDLERDPLPLPFTLNESTLQDLFTQKVYANLPSLPSEPYVGPMEILTSLSPGGWTQMGIAFPAVPPPPVKDGKKLPYVFLFKIPKLKIETKIMLDPETLKPIQGIS